MPTEYKPGNIDKSSSDSIVDILSNSNLPAIHSDFVKKKEQDSLLNNQQSPIPPKYKKKQPKSSFFETLGLVLTSDILWFSVALACLLATVLFYFQVLQPLILQKYIDNAQAQIIESNQKFNSQINEFVSLQQDIVTNLQATVLDPCSEDAKYTQSEKDQESLENIKKSLTIDSKLKELPNFYIFSDQETKVIYNKFIADYSEALINLEPIVDQTKQAIDLADYKNTWIDSCISINNSKGDTKELQAICQNISNKTNFYQKIGPKSITDLLIKPLEENTNLCKDILASKSLNYPQYSNFQLKWLSQLDVVSRLALTPNQSLTDSVTTKFQNSVIGTQEDLNKLFEKRIELTNIWYILELNFR